MLRISEQMAAAVMLVGAAVYASPAQAISVTVSTDANVLAAALGGGGLVIHSATLSGHATSSGTFTNASGTYGIGAGIVLSTGAVTDYGDGPNTVGGRTTVFGVPATAAQENLLDSITGGGFDHFDVTQLDLNFSTSTGELFFNVVFGSEEFPEFVGSTFIDGFGLFLNGTNMAIAAGHPVNINHPDMVDLAGTELDGILAPGGNPVMTFSATGLSTTAAHILTFILADTFDSWLDSTVYIASLAATPPSPIPEPATWALLGLGLAGLGLRHRKLASWPNRM